MTILCNYQIGAGNTYGSWNINLQGYTGATGAAGSAGTSGTSGTSGDAGSSGTSGSNGSSGTSGSSGSTGTSGSAGTSGVSIIGPTGATGAAGSGGSTVYGVRLNYDTSNVVIGSPAPTILSVSPWTSAGLTVTVTSNTDVKFQFSNETTPPKNILGYFYNANTDKYIVTNWGLGSVGYSISTLLSSSISSSIATNSFFSSFSSYQIQLDVTPSNFGGAKKNAPPVFIHAYVVFQF
jgi:hypothetical protein